MPIHAFTAAVSDWQLAAIVAAAVVALVIACAACNHGLEVMEEVGQEAGELHLPAPAPPEHKEPSPP